MFECAKNLEFEKAAAIRDKLSTVKKQVFGADGHDSDEKSKNFVTKERKIGKYILLFFNNFAYYISALKEALSLLRAISVPVLT